MSAGLCINVHQSLKRVTFSRGSSIAKIIGHNVKASNRFDPIVNMWVYEEIINGRKLTEIINTEHENVKYLPGHKLPKNVVGLDKQPCPLVSHPILCQQFIFSVQRSNNIKLD